jgi:hypothetical protein
MRNKNDGNSTFAECYYVGVRYFTPALKQTFVCIQDVIDLRSALRHRQEKM